MKRRIQIPIIAILALLVNGFCTCAAAAAPNCSAPSCAAHENHGACPAHQRHHESSSGHGCCQTAACSSSTAISTDTDSHAANHPAPPAFAVGTLLRNLGVATAGLAQMTAAPSPPFAVPVFLALRILLL